MNVTTPWAIENKGNTNNTNSIDIEKGNDNNSDNYIYISLSDANYNGISYKIKTNGEIVYYWKTRII